MWVLPRAALLVVLCIQGCGSNSGLVGTNDSNGDSSSSSSSSSGGTTTEPRASDVDPGERIVAETFSMLDHLDFQPVSAQKLGYASASSEGELTFASSDETVATVDDMGGVTILKAGLATVSATNTAFEVSDLDLDVIDPGFTMTAWVGEADTLLNFSTGAEGIEVTRSRDEFCDAAQYIGCSFGQSDPVTGSPIVDTAAHLNQPGYYTFAYGKNQSTSSVLGAINYSERWRTSMALYNDKLWVVGGRGNGLEYLDDVWSSNDGDTWERVAASTPFGARERHSLIEYDGKLWLIAGTDNENSVSGRAFNDVWTTTDGRNWTRVTAAAPFSPRKNPGLFVFQGKLWVMGGTNLDLSKPMDLWYTEDGVNWTEVVVDPYPGNLSWSNFEVLNDRLWLMTETVPEGEAKHLQVWSTADGIDWTLELDNFDFGYHPSMRMVKAGNELWAFGNNRSEDKGWIWKTTDGVNWEKVHGGNFWGNIPHDRGRIFYWHDQFYLISGDISIFKGHNAIWTSTDGLNWSNRGAGGLYAARAGHAMTRHDGKFYSLGGRDGESWHDDLWSSQDGLSWQLVNQDLPFNNRMNHALLSFKDRLWMIGGNGTAGGLVTTDVDGDETVQFILLRAYNAVWSSADGTSWEQTPNVPFSARNYASAIVFDDKMWVVSGGSPVDGVIPSDVWVSADGESWQQATAAAAFAGRSGHALAVHNGRLYLSGGADAEGHLFKDVWSTTDGVSWVQEAAEPGFVNRAHHQMVAKDGKLWIFGGEIYNYDIQIDFEPTIVEGNDVWSSADGKTWVEENSDSLFEVRRGHQVLVFDEQFYLFGGRGRDGSTEGSVDNQLRDLDYRYFQEVWSSADGATWRQGFAQDLVLKTKYAQ